MTGLEMLVAKEIIERGAKMLFTAVQDDQNSLTSDQAKRHSKNAMAAISEDAKKAILHHLPKHLKL